MSRIVIVATEKRFIVWSNELGQDKAISIPYTSRTNADGTPQIGVDNDKIKVAMTA